MESTATCGAIGQEGGDLGPQGQLDSAPLHRERSPARPLSERLPALGRPGAVKKWGKRQRERLENPTHGEGEDALNLPGVRVPDGEVARKLSGLGRLELAPRGDPDQGG